MIMRILFALALLTIWIGCSVACYSAETQLSTGSTQIKMLNGPGNVVSVCISITKTPRQDLYRHSFMWGGDESQPPRWVISEINVVENRQMLVVPLSAYADLGDPRRMILDPLSAGHFKLTILGGDAAGAYKASMQFDQREIVRRRVVSGEFPDDVWEETTYSFNHLDN